jgi:hypothetical protein
MKEEMDLDIRVDALVPLTKNQELRRQELENSIFDTVQQSYLKIGAYLEEIATKKLFQSTHWTFKEYCHEVLDMAKRRAYQYVQAHRVVKYLLPTDDEATIVDSQNKNNDYQTSEPWFTPLPQSEACYTQIPTNERQARALVGLEPEVARAIWLQAIESAPDGKITAAHIRKTVRQFKGEQTKQVVEKAKRARSANKKRLSETFYQAFRTFLSAVQKEIDSKWNTTDRMTVIDHLDAVRGAISTNGSHRIPEKGYAIELSNMEKLRAAGFNIYRTDEKLLLVEKYGLKSWEVHAVYPDLQAREQAFDELLKNQKNLRG